MIDDVADVRAKRAARRGACFDRLDDAVSELVILHRLDGDEIIAFVGTIVALAAREANDSPGQQP